MQRILQPELLDTLDAAAPLAQRMRRDLKRINAFMRHASLLTTALRTHAPARKPLHLLELGGGDGYLLLRLARRLAAEWPGLEVTLLDRQPAVRPETLAALRELGWRTTVRKAELFDLTGRPVIPAADVVIANLLLHHFAEPQLRSLLASVAARTSLFIALEPRRSRWSLWGAKLTGLIGCHPSTRRDAMISVRAGFTGAELSALWPVGASQWQLIERPAGGFSHLFLARRDD